MPERQMRGLRITYYKNIKAINKIQTSKTQNGEKNKPGLHDFYFFSPQRSFAPAVII